MRADQTMATAQATAQVVRETFEVIAADGVKIFVAEKYVPSMENKKAVLLLHPGNGLGHVFWDLPLPGYSVMDYLAEHGFRVFGLDSRGFGNSDHPQRVTYEGCSRDVEAVVQHIKNKYGYSKVNLIASSHGATVASYFVGENQDSVERLVLIGYQYKKRPAGEKAQQAIVDLVNKGVFYVHEKPSLEPGPEVYDAPPEMLRLYHDLIKEKNPTRTITIRTDEAGRETGAANIPHIRVPTLIIRGDHDTNLQGDNLQCFKDIEAREKAYLEIGNAGHSSVRGRTHMVLFRALLGWLSD